MRELADVALYEASKPGTRAYFPVFTIAVLGSGHHREHPQLLAFFGLVWLAAGWLRWSVPKQALKHRAENPDLWRQRFRWSILPTPITWGLFCLITTYHHGIDWQTLVCVFVAGGLSTGATAAFHLDRRLHRNYVLLLWIPVLLGLAFQWRKSQGAEVLVLTSILYTLFLLRVGRQHGENYWRGLRDRLFVSQMAHFAASMVPRMGPEEVPQKLQDVLVPLIRFERAWTEPGSQPSSEPDTLSAVLGTTPGHQLTFKLSRKGGFSRRDTETLAAFATPASNALDRSELFIEVQRMARYDSLTGVANRAHFFESAHGILEVSRRLDDKSGRPTHHSVILLDIDHFKSVNDRFGHDVGDHVLREVAQRCQGSLRQVDIFARYGGEEFVVFLPGANLPEAAEFIAERLRQAVGASPFSTAEVPVTISLGVAQIGSEETLEGALSRADKALYAAKGAGRNLVRTATSI